MRNVIPFLLLLLGIQLSAQEDIRLFKPSNVPVDSTATTSVVTRTNDSLPTDSVAHGVVTVVENDRIKALMADYAAHKRPLDGYRVQIFLGDRTMAESTRRTFLLQHPEIPAYLS